MQNHFGIGTKIYFGKNSLRSLKEIEMKNVCIVTDLSMVSLGLIDPVIEILKEKKIQYRIFDKVLPDPNVDIVSEGVSHLVDGKPDTIIALGGGSVMDTAKAILYMDVRLQEKILRKEKVQKTSLVAIPTTSGTGSEVTSYSVITDGANRKIALAEKSMLPDVAILDPWFTRSLPKKVVAESGIDVFTHALEAYVSKKSNSFSQAYVTEALRLLDENLVKMYMDINDEEARSKMHVASCLAGLAFESSSLGLNHGVAHSIGGKFHKAHGLCNGILLPYIISYNMGLYSLKLNEEVVKKYAEVAEFLKLKGESEFTKAKALIEYIKNLNHRISIPESFSALGIDKYDYEVNIDSMVDATMEDKTTAGNPIKVNRDQVMELYGKIY